MRYISTNQNTLKYANFCQPKKKTHQECGPEKATSSPHLTPLHPQGESSLTLALFSKNFLTERKKDTSQSAAQGARASWSFMGLVLPVGTTSKKKSSHSQGVGE